MLTLFHIYCYCADATVTFALAQMRHSSKDKTLSFVERNHNVQFTSDRLFKLSKHLHLNVIFTLFILLLQPHHDDDSNNRVHQQREPVDTDSEILLRVHSPHHRRNGILGPHPHREVVEIMSRAVNYVPVDTQQERQGDAREGG